MRAQLRRVAAPGRPEKEDLLESAHQILIKAQHVPLTIVLEESHDFIQMVVRPENKPAWGNLAKEIFKTKRGMTLSLIPQLAWVAVSQVLTTVHFSTTGEGDNSVVLGLAINSLWAWMIFLVWGWVYVGTQRNVTSIRDTICAIKPP